MKKTTILLLGIFSALTSFAQDITGQWNGILKVPGARLRLVFNIEKTVDGYRSTLDSPDQGATGIPVTSTTFEKNELKLVVANAGIEYTGEWKDNRIAGTFNQGGQSFPMDLSREAVEKKAVARPQEPVKPYPYYSEDVTFENKKDGVSLAGTLTLPEKDGKFPVVVLISGSGPQNRDEELLGHKPFLVLSDYLTKNGIAVLRYDDRGTASSTGNFEAATSADFASDAEAAVQFLKTRKEIDKKRIGLMGHSEGGLIAPMVASRSGDIRFIVLLAGTGIPGDQLLLLQQELIGRAGGAAEAEIQNNKANNAFLFDLVRKSNDPEKLKSDLTEQIKKLVAGLPEGGKPAGVSDDDLVAMIVAQVAGPWMQYFIKCDPAAALEKVTCPVLAVNGEKDLQVPPGENLAAIEKALKKGGNKQVTTRVFPNLNHLFQECKTGLPDEYGEIEQTFSPAALEEITAWVLKQAK